VYMEIPDGKCQVNPDHPLSRIAMRKRAFAIKKPVSIGKRRIQPVCQSIHWIVVFLMSVVTVADRTSAAAKTTVWQRWEQVLTSSREYRNPFKDVTVSVAYSGPDGTAFKSLAFWDGDSTFKIRCAFPVPGTWSWQTTCSDTTDKGLHDKRGKVYVRPYHESNPLYRHGFLCVSANRRQLAYADGTPFLWIGDTYWAATTRLSERGFRRWVDDRASKHFTLLQTNIARFKKGPVDADGNVLWNGDRPNVHFMQKLDREFDYANDKGLVLFVNGLIDLKWDLKIDEYPRLVQMIAARYFAHFVTYSSSMDDGFSAEHDEINELIDRVTDRHLLTQHTGTSDRHPVKYYDRTYLDYSMSQSGHHGNNDEKASNAAIAWHLNLYNRQPHKPVVNGEAWYDGMATPEQAAEMGYLSMLSGCFGYTYGVAGKEGDDELDGFLNRKGAVYMKYLHDFFAGIDCGRCLKPRHELIDNQKPDYRYKSVLAVTEDGAKYVAFLRKGGEIRIDLGNVPSRLSGKWFNAITGEYGDAFSIPGGDIRSITSCFGSAPSLIVLEVVKGENGRI